MFFEVRLLLPEVFKILNITSRGDLLKIIGDHFEDKPLRLEYQGDSKVEDGDEMNFNRLILGVVDLEHLVPLGQRLGLDKAIWANITDRSMPEQRIQCATYPDSFLTYSTFAQLRGEMGEGAEVDQVKSKRNMVVSSLRIIFGRKQEDLIPPELQIEIYSTLLRAEKISENGIRSTSARVLMSPWSEEIWVAAQEEMSVEDIVPRCSALVDKLLAEFPWVVDVSASEISALLDVYNYSVGREVVVAED